MKVAAGAAVLLAVAGLAEAESERVPCHATWWWYALTPGACRDRGCVWDPAGWDVRSWCRFPGSAPPLKTVHVVMGAHLDVGFADAAPNILDLWFHKHFPRAAALGAELARNASGPQLQFTAQSWLISLYFDCPSGLGFRCPTAAEKRAVERAIRAGYITWHAFPFNAQLELLNPAMIREAVALTHRLDKRFNVTRKRVLSQRDVPGITRAALPTLREAGVAALSVGVNGGSTPPNVPRAFLWRDRATGLEMPSFWLGGGYGGFSLFGFPRPLTRVPGSAHGLIVAWRGDNSGPPGSAAEVRDMVARLQRRFPGAEVRVSTFDAFFAAAAPAGGQRSGWPVVTREIGDTWMYGVASDPVKLRLHRAFQGEYAACVSRGACLGGDARLRNFTRLLLKNAEHTWGLDVKSTLTPRAFLHRGFRNTAFRRLRAASRAYRRLEHSWTTQARWGLDAAVEALGSHPMASRMRRELHRVRRGPRAPNVTRWQQLGPAAAAVRTWEGCGVRFRVDGASGALALVQGRDNATVTGAILEPRYHTYSARDYAKYELQYNYATPFFVAADFDDQAKVGIGQAGARHREASPVADAVFWRPAAGMGCGPALWVRASFPAASRGAAASPPRRVWVRYQARADGRGVDAEMRVLGKAATRLPETLSWRVAPNRAPLAWRVHKVDRWVDAADVQRGGATRMHGVTEQGLEARLRDPAPYVPAWRSQVLTPDAGLAAVGAVTGLPHPTTDASQQREASLVILNNLWATNYVMWTTWRSLAVRASVVVEAA